MCGRYTIAGKPATAAEWRRRMQDLLGADPSDLPDELIYGRFNVAPRQQLPLIERAKDGSRRFSEARWGLLPSWAKTSRDRQQPINARDSNLNSRMWKPLMEPRHRVLLPADGYYEWVRAENPKEKPAPFYHQVDDGQPFAFAALRNTTRVDDLEDPITTVALITTSPNATAARVHDRMPAILADPEAMEAWLSPEVSAEDARALLHPIADDRLTVRPVSKRVNSSDNDGPELLDPEEP